MCLSSAAGQQSISNDSLPLGAYRLHVWAECASGPSAPTLLLPDLSLLLLDVSGFHFSCVCVCTCLRAHLCVHACRGQGVMLGIFLNFPPLHTEQSSLILVS